METFSDIRKAEIITGRLVLQKILSKMIYAEVNNTKWKYSSTERKEEGQKWCNIVICNKYVFGFFHSSWHTAPKILEISYIRAIGTSFVIISGLLSSVPEIASEPCLLLFITNRFQPYLRLCLQGGFWKAP